MKISGEIDSFPDIKQKKYHPRSLSAPGDYYINFQDPSGEPSSDPLVINGNTYMKLDGTPTVIHLVMDGSGTWQMLNTKLFETSING